MADETVTNSDEEGAPDFQPASEGEHSAESGDDTGTASDEGAGDQPEEPADDEAGEEQLLTPEEQAKFANDPAGLVKAMQKAFTQKTQKLAKLRQLGDALRDNPEGVVRAFAQKLGLAIQDKPAETKTETDVQAEVNQILEQQFGSDSAQALAPAITKLVSHLVEKAVGPLHQFRQETINHAAYNEAKSTVTAFEAKYKDFKQYDAKMAALAAKIQPADMTDFEYMEHLYHTVKGREERSRRATGDQQRTERSVRAGSARPPGVAGTRVAETPPHKPTFREAAAAARKGVRFEYDE